MRKFLVLTIILTLIMSLCAFVPTMVGAESPATDEDTAQTLPLDMLKLNTPIYNDVDYYINIKNPSIFASYEKILAVVQGDDILVKLDDEVEIIKGAAYYEEGGRRYPIKNIAINSRDRLNGHIFLTYNNKPSYKTVIYQYFVGNTSDKFIRLFGDFAKYIEVTHPTAPLEIKEALNTSASDISTVYTNNECTMYVVAQLGKVYKITRDNISLIDIDSNSQGLIYSSPIFTVNNDGDMYIYGGNDTEHKMHKKSATSTTFEEVATLLDVVDIVARGEYLYLLSSDSVAIYYNSQFKASNATADKTPLFQLTFESACKSFDISNIGEDTFISFALEGNDNISTYKLVEKESRPTLEYYNHYGANCACTTPHQGWLNKPEIVAAAPHGKTIYVVDNEGKRLVIMKYDAETKMYNQYFYPSEKLLLDKITDVQVDRHGSIYIASSDKIYVYNNSEKYNDDKALPLKRIQDIDGFDGAIVEVKMQNKSESMAYVLTDKNSVYMISEKDMTAKPIATFDEKISSIAPSSDGSRIYVSTTNTVRSYPIDGIDITSPLTTFTSQDYNLGEIYVDYNGNVYAATSTGHLLRYNRISDSDYRLSNIILTRPMALGTISDYYIDENTKEAYIVDATLHIALRIDDSRWSKLFTNSTDKYIDKNAYDPSLLYVAKTDNVAKVYKSPTNYEIYREAKAGEYFYLLAVDKNNEDMYLAVDSESNLVYIKKTNLTKIESTTDSILGVALMPLFGSANIYMYPFENAASQPIDATKGTMNLVHNVAYDNGVCWQNTTTKWIKVSYVSAQNVPLEGYVKMNEVTRSTVPTAPSTKIHLRVCTDGVETVSMYDAPDLASGILMSGIKNGTLVRLMQEEFDTTQEFTLVELETENGGKLVGYILTKNLQENTFTTLQIVAIIVSVITVVITIVVIILIVEFKKKKDNINTFREDESSRDEQ